MKWFKHISDSLDDPFISDMFDKFGDFGYVCFFGILEIYAREFKIDDGWKLDVNLRFIRDKLHQRSTARIKRYLSDDQVTSKWKIKIYQKCNQERCEIYIPKFLNILDEHTRNILRKHGKNSGVTHKSLMPKEVDKEAEADSNKKAEAFSLPDQDQVDNSSVIKLRQQIDAISKEIYESGKWNKINAWINKMRKEGKNDRAILHTLIRCYGKSEFKSNPWGYCTKIIQIENGNYNERDNARTQG